jgi:enamine deaminase RidA (YjgF/YER057c/UK114 family)
MSRDGTRCRPAPGIRRLAGAILVAMPIEHIDPPDLYPGAPYHYATVASGGRSVFAAGACPIDEQGVVDPPGDLEGQAARALENLLVALRTAEAGPKDLVKTTVYVAGESRDDLVRAWTVIAAGLAPARPPSTLLGVSFLGYPGQLVEIEAIAVTG